MIVSLATALPDQALPNDALARADAGKWSPEEIFKKTGIRSRRVLGPDENASDLAVKAGQALLTSSECEPGEVDFLLYCTQAPDFLLPTTACLLQDALDLPTSCGAFDMNLGCSGYVYGLGVLHGLLESGLASNALLLTADAYSRYAAPDDLATRTIFGDAGTATLLAKRSKNELKAFVFGSDGGGKEQLILKGGIAERFAATRSEESRPGCLHMNGPEIFNFTLRAVPRLVDAVLSKAKLGLEEIDHFVFHQANAYMLERLRRKIGIERNRFVIHLEDLGNTVSSTIPLALDHLLKESRLVPGQKVMLVGFGVGYSWGGAILEWNESV